MNFYDYVNMLKHNDIPSLDLTLPECKDFIDFLRDISYNRMSQAKQKEFDRMYKDFLWSADDYERYTEAMTLEEVSQSEMLDDKMMDLKIKLDDIAQYIQFDAGLYSYFKW